jgi:hypothetical protein
LNAEVGREVDVGRISVVDDLDSVLEAVDLVRLDSEGGSPIGGGNAG